MFTSKISNLLRCLGIALILALLTGLPAAAQNTSDEGLVLRLSRDFGYSGSGEIQGTFSMRVSGPADLARVVFYVDDLEIGEASAGPFRLRFSTDNFSVGIHSLSAVGYTASGTELKSNVIRAKFVTADAGFKAVGKILVPILAVVVIAMLVTTIPFFGKGRKSQTPLGAERKYGVSGGAICKNCHRPFSLNFFGMNLMLGKLDRCPYCGHWGVYRSVSMAKLREAEQAELATANSNGTVPQASEEEKLRKELDNSRFQDI